ncbi:hypothetical protein AU210_010146 [Fusarium oxysporum f. sp. radicis-cucumerinum]|uniref:Uncharacterized protein n=1 Tax=Fusarium oxysporum f. sp. radicis-cucumerinum TaxID=327505 RepID=A0A2H3GI99_FUSOX|nr:hypothetical protein AU210_010146 [Fusarium oxysporum f. sp. radicis-cucumerinum]
MSAPNNNPPPTKTGKQARGEIEDRLMRFVQARYQENAEVTLEMVTQIIGDQDPVGDDGWDQAAEDRMEARWETSSRKRSSDKVGTRGNNDNPLREVWRFCLRFMKQAPPIMLSPINGLQFMPARVTGDFAFSSDLFTVAACGTLAKLIVHPLWRGDHRPFVDALIFAALCRVDAKANINLSLRWPPQCPVIQALNARLTEATNTNSDLPETLHKLHLAARETVYGNGDGDKESIFSEVLYHIGMVAIAESPSSGERAQLRQRIVPFQGKDLEVIKKAIDDLASTSRRMDLSVEDVHAAFKFVGHRGELPSKLQLRELDARACHERTPEPASRAPEEARRARPRSRGRARVDSRSRSPRALDPNSFPTRFRSRLRSASSAQSDRDARPAERHRSSSPVFSPRHSNPANEGPSNRDGSTHGTPVDWEQSDDDYFPDDGGLADNLTNQGEVKGPRRSTPTPASPRRTRHPRPLLSQALAVDEIAQVRRDVATLGEKLRGEEAERGRLIEDFKTEQGHAFEAFKRQHAQAIVALNAEYHGGLEALRSEHVETLRGIEAEKSRINETATAQARLIDDLKARLDAREAQALIFSGELESKQSEIDDLRARLEIRATETEGLSDRFTKWFDELAAKQSQTERQLKEQSGLIQTLQEDNERLRQSAQAVPAQTCDRAPTPAEALSRHDVSERDEPSRDTETLLSIFQGRPDGVSFPAVAQRAPVVRLTSSGDGILGGRNNCFLDDPGCGDSAYKQSIG